MLNDVFYAIGLMSGTSLDGVDLIYVKFNYSANYSFTILESKTYPYSIKWKQKLANAFTSSKEEISVLDMEYGRFLGKLTNGFITENKISELDFIASHGHTIFHKPEKGYTLQIGDGQEIANLTNHKVVCDFRTQDVDLGGQGAPLVPIGDRLLFGTYDYCLNLGGFANISYDDGGKRIAYDVCPVNIGLNHYVKKLNLQYDDKGKIASSGVVNRQLLEALNQLQFYTTKPPKSLGLEWVEAQIFPLIDQFKLEVPDILRTLVEHIAIQVTDQIESRNKSVLVTGGGALNEFLMARIQELTQATISIPEKQIIEYKEALIFALLGLLRIQNKINILSSVTGAKKDHSSGKIFLPKS